MYVDEVGNADLKSSNDPNHRYLSLTGVVLDLDYVDRVVAPELEALKRRYFKAHVDEPLVFHRKELVNRKYPFHALREPEVEEGFNADLLFLLGKLHYKVITAVIDKQEYCKRYQVWQHHPYHYCQEVLVERYVASMAMVGKMGDVLAESRGTRADRELKDAYKNIYDHGTGWVEKEVFQARLTSKELKLKRKTDNIAGLQLADLIAHPSFKATLLRQSLEALPQDFGGRIAAILEAGKYRCSPTGRSTAGAGNGFPEPEKQKAGPKTDSYRRHLTFHLQASLD
ncbi:MAG TPA: DUF3800 domain-containing protein [Thermoanaerobaculia bacterium]|nr:DUF3800 domain-containing protein [Thermoanaerobaculia bacterium]